MKKLKLLTLTIIILTSISFKPKSSDNNEKVSNEIIGTWIKKSDQKNSKKSIADHILEITFKKNSTAKIKVFDSLGTRTIKGKWSSKETEYFKKIVGNNAKLPSDNIILEYLRNGKGMNVMTLSKEINNGKVLLKSGPTIFEKK